MDDVSDLSDLTEIVRGYDEESKEDDRTGGTIFIHATEPNDFTDLESTFSESVVKSLIEYIYKNQGILKLPSGLEKLKKFEAKSVNNISTFAPLIIETPVARAIQEIYRKKQMKAPIMHSTTYTAGEFDEPQSPLDLQLNRHNQTD